MAAATAEAKSLGSRICVARADVADPNAVDAAGERTERGLGPVDLWVNHAIASVFAPFLEVTPKEFDRVMSVTFGGQVNGTRTALCRMLPRDRRSIAQVGSVLAYSGIPLQPAYCASTWDGRRPAVIRKWWCTRTGPAGGGLGSPAGRNGGKATRTPSAGELNTGEVDIGLASTVRGKRGPALRHAEPDRRPRGLEGRGITQSLTSGVRAANTFPDEEERVCGVCLEHWGDRLHKRSRRFPCSCSGCRRSPDSTTASPGPWHGGVPSWGD